MTRHIISVLVENEAGALSRIAGLFSARGYNIETLTVAPTEDASMSRMTIVTTGSEDVIEQITKQLNKLIEVVKVIDLSEAEHRLLAQGIELPAFGRGEPMRHRFERRRIGRGRRRFGEPVLPRQMVALPPEGDQRRDLGLGAGRHVGGAEVTVVSQQGLGRAQGLGKRGERR